MPASQRRPVPGVIARLEAAPYRFQFMQAVRLVLIWLRREGVPPERALRHILRFNETSVADYARGALSGISLGDYFSRRGFSSRLLRDYLAPMGAAIWSTPVQKMLDFPAENFVAFFINHCLLQYDRPAWRTGCGGARRSGNRFP